MQTWERKNFSYFQSLQSSKYPQRNGVKDQIKTSIIWTFAKSSELLKTMLIDLPP